MGIFKKTEGHDPIYIQKICHLLNSQFFLEYFSLTNYMKFILKENLFVCLFLPTKMKAKGIFLLL